MYGAVYGDLIGSLYEYKEYLNHDVRRMIEASEESELLKSECFISDDTILTVAVRDAFINGLAYDETFKKYVLANSEPVNREEYFKYAFSPNTIKWAKGETEGISTGNGAIMRISAIPDVSDNYIFMLKEVEKATKPTHNSISAIKAAKCISTIIFLAKSGMEKERIKYLIDKHYRYEYDFNIDNLREKMFFNTTCDDTMPLILYVIFNTNSFDEAMRMSLSLGGDTDTNCCIIGSIAEALYGMDESLKERVDLYIPKDYSKILRADSKLV